MKELIVLIEYNEDNIGSEGIENIFDTVFEEIEEEEKEDTLFWAYYSSLKQAQTLHYNVPPSFKKENNNA